MPRQFANWITEFEKLHENSQTPASYVFWTGVSAIAGALGRNVRYNGGRFSIYPNHYIILVGRPAITKSTAINLGFDLMKQVESINIGPNGVTWQHLVDLFVQINQGKVTELLQNKPLVSESAAMSVAASELGNFLDFDNRELLDFLCVLWDSGDYEKATRMMGSQKIFGGCLNLLAATTPRWIQLYVKPEFFDTGLLARTNFIFEESPRRRIAWAHLEIQKDHSQTEDSLKYDLAEISKLSGEVTFTPEALKLGDLYHEKTSKEAEDSQDFTANWTGRKWVHMIKLSICLSVAKSNSLIIDGDTMQKAINHIDALHSGLFKIVGMIQQKKELEPLHEIEKYVLEQKAISVKSINNRFYKKYLSRDITGVIKSLTDSGICKYENLGGETSLVVVEK